LAPVRASTRKSRELDAYHGDWWQPILDHLTSRPPLDLAYDVETETRLPAVAGGLSVALARSFKIIDSHLKNPNSEHWRRSMRIFDLLL
jgi:hypothetical protein